MTPERWRRIQDLLDEVVELPEEKRDPYLAEACGDDSGLAGEVRSLLRQHRPDSFLEPPAAEPEPGGAEGPEAESLVGQEVGAYHVVRELGRGGMGVVYEAHQRRPVERRVALKLVKWGMDTRQVIARFESERQALALMSHPSIAAVYDAGATERGRPWFAMEYVSGVPITEYCDVHKLSVERRLDLFMRVCEAIQHAHQKGIIHRDIKPPNVLVTLKDGSALPKVIDFGVAKATAQRLTEKTLYTELGQLIGTPSYMSPEQAEMSGLDIDTRSDVYSLGALLYELLAGSQPFDSTELRRASLDEIRRRIREEDPALASVRVAGSSGGAGVAAKRGLPDAASLARELRGDLDWIAAKALSKNRTDRYGTASELAEDVSRHLRHEPVRASPPGVGYRLAKFARRHRAGVLSGGVVALALLVGLTGTAIGLVRARDAERTARQEAAKAEAVSGFLKETIGAANAEAGLGPDATVLEALELAVARIEASFADQPVTEAAVRTTIGETLIALGRLPEAGDQLQRALAIQERLLGPDHEDLAATLNELGALYEARGEYEEGLVFHTRTLEMRRRLSGDEDPEIASSLLNVGTSLWGLGRRDEARETMTQALELSDRLLGPSHIYSVKSRLNLGVMLRNEGHEDQAEGLYREALDGLAARSLPSPPLEALVLNNLARLIETRGEPEKALGIFEQAIARASASLGEQHHQTLGYKGNYGNCLAGLGRYEEAAAQLVPTVPVLRETVGDRSPFTQRALRNVVDLYEVWGRPEEAEPYRELLIPAEPDPVAEASPPQS